MAPAASATDHAPRPVILIVDDDPGIRDVVSDFLGRHGYKVETAADASEMERVLERGPVWELIAATGIIITIPMFFFALIIQRHFTKGMNLGAVR